MQKNLFRTLLLTLTLLILPLNTYAAGGIFASGGGTYTVGQTFTITVAASGATFDSLQGTISVSGPVSVVSFSAGSATWLPGKTPTNGGQFVGITSATSSLTVATIKLKGTSAGTGSVSVSGAKLASSGAVVGTSGGSASFTINKAPVLPGTVSVASSTHPDQNTAYEATNITLSWNKDSVTTGFSYLLDQSAGTTPPSTVTDANTTITYSNKAVGTYYFHIKGKSADGWGATTTFKITIKEPDPKIDATLNKPSDISITKTTPYTNDIVAGTFSGFKIDGKTQANFTANITLSPAVTVPTGKSLSVKADGNGDFELLVDFPINTGHYTLTIQGQNDKTLTPISDPVYFEISQYQGGQVRILSSNDTTEPVVVKPIVQVKKWYQKINWIYTSIGLAILSVILMIITIFLGVSKKKLGATFKTPKQ